ncbi:MAG TPA: hypothetical protein PLA33_01780 [Ottowia sp.]|nr:hypothetical protein [Ottowia sp.]HNI83846.1 hypothetical protein [Ottowia sp.]HNJ44836.1 hypothetical protein [Ottowia sp.]HNK51955.1 hypothetical protein [Ottowia sp.]HNL40831.1 hypothetical protein [Ottowia sp.]
MKAVEWVDRVKRVRSIESDYAAAKALGITRSAMSEIRNGHTLTLKEETALRVASIIGERPEAIIIDQTAERVKEPATRAALFDAARRLCVLC